MKHRYLVLRTALFSAFAFLCLFVNAATAQQRVSIEYPKEGDEVRGTITVRLKRDIQQGYFIVNLDGNFHAAIGEDTFVLSTIELANGNHTLDVEFHDASGDVAGEARVAFRVANGVISDTGQRFLFRHWIYDDYVKRVTARYRIWSQSIGDAFIKSKPVAAGAAGGGMPGMPGGGMPGMPGMGGMMPGEGGAMPGMAGMPGMPGMPGMGGGSGGAMPGMPGMGGMMPGEGGAVPGGMPGGGGMGGAGANQPPDTSAMDRQLSILLRQEVREVLGNGAANIRTIVQYAFERGRIGASGGGGMAGGMGGAGMPGMPGMMGMPGMAGGSGGGMPGMRGGGMPGMGGGASTLPGVKPPWEEDWLPSRELGKQQTRMIYPTGREIIATENSGPQGSRRHATIPLADLLPRFQERADNPREPLAVPVGTSWTSPMTFVVELVHRIAIKVPGMIQFTKFEDVRLRSNEVRRCAKLESVLRFAASGRLIMYCGHCHRRISISVRPGDVCPHCGVTFTDEIIGSANPAIIAAGLTAPLVGGSGGGGGMMGGGMMGGGEGSGMEGSRGGMRGGMPGMPGMGGASGGGMPGMPGGGMGGAGGSGQEGPDIRDAKTTINRTLYFDLAERKVVLALDDILTEYDIMGNAGGGAGMMGGGMPGMPGGSMGAGMPGMPGMGGGAGQQQQQQWTHVVYRVKTYTWLDTEPVKPTMTYNKGGRPNAHTYDHVEEPGESPISPSDPKNPARDRVRRTFR